MLNEPSSRAHDDLTSTRSTGLLLLCVLAIHGSQAPAQSPLSLASLATTPAGSGCNVVPPIPAVPPDATVFKHTAGSDLSTQLQSSLDKLRSGDWLVLEPGLYPIGKHLSVAMNGVTVYGKGATLHSSSATDGGILVRGDNVSIYNLTLTQASAERQTTPWSGGIAVFDDRSGRPRRVDGAMIRGNTINYAAGAGIFLYKVSRFTVADNTVFRSLADGIHLTGGSADGRVIRNTVSQTGDDMIGIVSYAGNRNAVGTAARYAQLSEDDLDWNVYVAENHLSDQYWGRGVSVVGGSNVTIENNTITRTPTAAAIYLLRENSYATFGDHNIVVRSNDISETQTLPPTYAPANYKLSMTHHGAIEVASQMDQDESDDARYRSLLSVADIEIAGNTVRNSRFAGIRLGANSPVGNTVTNVEVRDNRLQNVGQPIVASAESGIDRTTLSCAQNRVDGALWEARCDKDQDAAVKVNARITGASLTCRPDGTIGRSGPKPPSSLSIQQR